MRTEFSGRLKTAVHWIAINPANIFLMLGAFFGVLFIFRMAPLNGNDEFAYFPRAYQLQEGTLTIQHLSEDKYGGSLPGHVKTMVDDYRDLSRKESDDEYATRTKALNSIYSSIREPGEDRQEEVFTSAAAYPPWSYLPAAIGIRLSRLVHTSLINYVYIARLCCLVVWLLLTWLAIKNLPSGRWFMVAVALLPTSLLGAVTIGLGGMVMGLSWLVIAFTFKVLADDRASAASLGAIIISAAGLSAVKQGYSLLALWPLVIPGARFASYKAARLWKGLLVFLVLSISAAMALYSRAVLASSILTPRPGIALNPEAQMSYVLHNPLLFLVRIIYQPLTKSYDTVYLGLAGILTNRLIYLSVMIIVLLYLGMFLSFHYSKPLPKLEAMKHRLRSAALLIGIGTYSLISLGVYVVFTPVGWPVVEGINGRYFLPLLPLLLVIPLTRVQKIKTKRETFIAYVLTLILAGLISTLMSLM